MWVEFYEASVKGEPGIMEPEPGGEMTATNAKHSHTYLNTSVNATHK